jgi:glutamate-1-semialdehyde aminotransferase
VFLPASPFEAGFLSTAHIDADIDAALEKMESALVAACD